eukprot:14312495-Alexandrium_andersonii.AAC.1
MTRLVYRLPRLSGENVWDWRIRHARRVEAIYRRKIIRPWVEQYLAAFWTWAGHFRRRPHRIAELIQF